MSGNFRVSNISSGETMKFKQAVRRVAECALAWVEYGKTVRNLDWHEAIAARNQAAKTAPPLEGVEPCGAQTKFEPPASARPYLIANAGILTATRDFYDSCNPKQAGA